MEHVDVLIVGAGISGIDAAYRLKTSLPKKTFAILEARDSMGGTWDLFRYPGIRSDSDMYTLGFPFHPWREPHSIGTGPEILAYVKETAARFGVDRLIRYRQRVTRARFRDGRWIVDVRDERSGAITQMTTRFLWACAGYYDYDEGYTPELPGVDRFRGRVVHPQKWTEDIEYAGKRVIVIGSGATAVTLVPALAREAAHVTMLQRSPTYILSLPNRDAMGAWLREKLPPRASDAALRWRSVLLGMGIYGLSRRFPARAKKVLLGQVKRLLGDEAYVEKHFTPRYDPWDQRLCLVPDADLFEAIKDKRASVVTDRIATFTERGVSLESGGELEADLIVTATGLKLKLFGGIALEVEGRVIRPQETMIYKGLMVSDVPNMAFAVGYTNASWTLKCDLAARYVCRLLRHMDDKGFTTCSPRADPSIDKEPLIDFSSGYVQRALPSLPSQGSVKPWKLHQNYALDRLAFERGKLEDGVMTFA